MQEEVERRAIAISLTAGKLTARTLGQSLVGGAAANPAAAAGGFDTTRPSVREKADEPRGQYKSDSP